MKHLLSIFLFLLITISSFAQFNDTTELSAYIRDTIVDRRPDKVTAGQLQKSLLGIIKFIPLATTPLSNTQIGYGNSNNILTGKSTFTFNDTTNTLNVQALQIGESFSLVNGAEYTTITPNSINVNHNSGSDNVVNITTNSNSFKRFTLTNTNINSSAGAGCLFINDVGSILQYYVGSSGNAFMPNGTLFRSTGSGGFNIVADNGPIAFGKSPYMGGAEFARFTTDGKLGIGTTNPQYSLDVYGHASFVSDQIYLAEEGYANTPSMHSTNSLTIYSDLDNFVFSSTQNGTSHYPILFLTTKDPNIPSLYSGVITGFDYTTATHTAGKPLIITTAGYGNGSINNGGDIIIRANSTQYTNYTAHGSGNWNIINDPCGQGVTKFLNTVSMAVSVVSGNTTMNNSANQWVFTGSGASTWLAPTIAGNAGNEYHIKNRGSGVLTVSRQGSDQFYTSAPTSTLTINPGESYTLSIDGTYINVEN